MQEKIIGFVTEPKLYRVGSFVLRQVAGVDRPLSEADPTMKVLQVFGLTSPQQLLDKTLMKYWDDLEATGKVKKALELLLTIEEGLEQKPLSEILDEMSRRMAAEVIADFFSMNFGSKPQSGVTAMNTASN